MALSIIDTQYIICMDHFEPDDVMVLRVQGMPNNEALIIQYASDIEEWVVIEERIPEEWKSKTADLVTPQETEKLYYSLGCHDINVPISSPLLISVILADSGGMHCKVLTDFELGELVVKPEFAKIHQVEKASASL